MHQKIANYAQRPFWDKLNFAQMAWAKLKTRFFYRLAFGSMGKGCLIASPIMLINTRHVYLGDNITIFHGARIETVTERFGVEFYPKIVIGNGTTFQQNLHLTCAQEIIIGSKVAVTENVGIFDIWHPFEDVTKAIVDQPLRTAPVHIGDETLIGMGAIIQPGVTIGKHCLIGANSVVTHNIPDYSVAIGAPARVIKRYEATTKSWTKV